MEKEMVKKFDLEAAFKALDEIEAPKAKGLKANRVDLKERFAGKTYGDALVEDYYNVNDHEALEEAQEDREEEIAKAKLARIEKIVDLDAESPEDLLPSYVGKVIIQCPQCMTLFYKNPEDIEKDEENPDVVNVNEVCQHCGNASGYTLIGKVGQVSEDEAANYEAAEEGTEEENELNLDFEEPTEEVSPEGTGGGFEEEEVTVEEDSSDDLEDLNLEEVEVEESLQREQLNEDVDPEEKVEATAEEVLDAAADAGNEVAKEVEADITKEEVKEITDEVVSKELDITLEDDSSDDELKEDLTPDEVANRLDAYAASLGEDLQECNTVKEDFNGELERFAASLPDEVEEGYKGTPEERTTHLEYVDDDPTDGKAVLPKAIDKQLTEGQFDVSDEDFKDMLQDRVWQEFSDDGKINESVINTGGVEAAIDSLDEVANEIAAEVEAEDQPVEEDINITNNDSHGRVDNRNVTKGEEKPAETIPTPTTTEPEVKEGLGDLGGLKPEIPALVNGGINVNLDASGQNNAVGFGGSTPKVESCENCEGEECKDCEDKKEEGLLSGVAGLANGLSNGIKDIPVVGQLLASDEEEKKSIKCCEEIHEESLNKHISDYLTEVYANVKDFQIDACSIKNESLIIEGTINFISGKTRKATFNFTESKQENGKVILEGYCKDLGEDTHFTLNCAFEDGGKNLLTESFGYKYTVNNVLVEGLK